MYIYLHTLFSLSLCLLSLFLRHRQKYMGMKLTILNTRALPWTGVASFWINENACHPSLIKISHKSPYFSWEDLLNLLSGTWGGCLAGSQSRISRNWQQNLWCFKIQTHTPHTYVYIAFLPIPLVPCSSHMALFTRSLRRQLS